MAADSMQLSVIIITHNEEANIGDCLHSVHFADEVIVLDNASTDKTAEIAKSLGAVVHVASEWPGFGPQKNKVLALAKGDWILSIDADERVTPELCHEILQAIASNSATVAYDMPRLSSYCGQFILHSGWRPDFVRRLFKRGTACFSDDVVHEQVLCNGMSAKLTSSLLHLSFPDFESVLDKVNRYSSAGADAMTDRGENASFQSAVWHGLWSFLRTYVIRLGFLDGQLGLALAISNAEGTYYRYAKRWFITYKHRRS